MSNALIPTFGKRRPENELTPSPERPPVAPQQQPLPENDPGLRKPLAPTASPALLELRQLALGRLDPAIVATMPADKLTAEVERLLAEIANDQRMQLNAREQKALALELVDDMLGLGPIEPLLDDDTITDIMINGPERVFVERRGTVVLSNVRFRDVQHLSNIAQRIAARVGRRIDESAPLADARLQDGSRVNIVFPPLALDGPYISIRKFARRRIDFPTLVRYGSMTAQLARILELSAKSRLNVIISGGTGSGKTTLLNAMSRMIDLAERVVTVEDAAELQLQQPHVVRLETRPPNLEGKGEITQRDLVRNALRMRPDRIILGECRGAEAFDMLQAMNTGHDGSMSTVHANTTRDALTRIENMVMMGNLGLPAKAIRTQILGAVDLIVQVERQRDGVRRIMQVTEVAGMEGDVFTLNDIFHLEHDGEDLDGRLRTRYRVSRARPSFSTRLAYFGTEQAWAAALEEAER
jgi:pilus assembly protein CpaF